MAEIVAGPYVLAPVQELAAPYDYAVLGVVARGAVHLVAVVRRAAVELSQGERSRAHGRVVALWVGDEGYVVTPSAAGGGAAGEGEPLGLQPGLVGAVVVEGDGVRVKVLAGEPGEYPVSAEVIVNVVRGRPQCGVGYPEGLHDGGLVGGDEDLFGDIGHVGLQSGGVRVKAGVRVIVVPEVLADVAGQGHAAVIGSAGADERQYRVPVELPGERAEIVKDTGVQGRGGVEMLLQREDLTGVVRLDGHRAQPANGRCVAGGRPAESPSLRVRRGLERVMARKRYLPGCLAAAAERPGRRSALTCCECLHDDEPRYLRTQCASPKPDEVLDFDDTVAMLEGRSARRSKCRPTRVTTPAT